jgi:hypothetical protein
VKEFSFPSIPILLIGKRANSTSYNWTVTVDAPAYATSFDIAYDVCHYSNYVILLIIVRCRCLLIQYLVSSLLDCSITKSQALAPSMQLCSILYFCFIFSCDFCYFIVILKYKHDFLRYKETSTKGALTCATGLSKVMSGTGIFVSSFSSTSSTTKAPNFSIPLFSNLPLF